jgi:hypothetical protein
MNSHIRAGDPSPPRVVVAARSMMAAGIQRSLLRIFMVGLMAFITIYSYAQAPAASGNSPLRKR